MISSDLTFYSLEDFFKRKYRIRAIYLELCKDKKYVYKYYVYSRRILKDRTCDLIWEFLNEEDDFMVAMIEDKLEQERYRYPERRYIDERQGNSQETN